jgi:hypothetical protein
MKNYKKKLKKQTKKRMEKRKYGGKEKKITNREDDAKRDRPMQRGVSGVSLPRCKGRHIGFFRFVIGHDI